MNWHWLIVLQIRPINWQAHLWAAKHCCGSLYRSGEFLSLWLREMESSSAAAPRSHTASANDGRAKQTISTLLELMLIISATIHLHVRVETCAIQMKFLVWLTCTLTFLMKCVCGSDNSLHDLIAHGQCTLKQLWATGCVMWVNCYFCYHLLTLWPFDLQQCPGFPIHWFICGGPSQYPNWPLQIDFPKGLYFVQKSFDVHFVLTVMPDKVAFVSSGLIWLQPLPGKPLYLLLHQGLLLAEN